MPDRPVGRCIGCMHDFSAEEFCGGCGAMEHPKDKWIREGDAEDARIAAARPHIRAELFAELIAEAEELSTQQQGRFDLTVQFLQLRARQEVHHAQ